MSTTTDPRSPPTGRAGFARTLLLALPLVGAGWIGTLAATMTLTGAAPAALVIFPAPGLADRLPHGVRILSATRWTVTVAGDTPGLTRALYRAGARLVLPSGLSGCMSPDRR
jgi:hypothetical protein